MPTPDRPANAADPHAEVAGRDVADAAADKLADELRIGGPLTDLVAGRVDARTALSGHRS